MSTTTFHAAPHATPTSSTPAERSSPGCPLHGLLRPADPAGASPLPKRLAIFTLGLVAYAAFFAAILYAIGFVANVVVPKSIDSGTPSPLWSALAINASLLMLFVVQHTVMARPAFKRWWTRIVPSSGERSIFVLAASASLMLLFWQWRPLPDVIWDVQLPAARWTLFSLSMLGWAIVFASSFMVSHWDLFGLRQVTHELVGRPCQPLGFRIVGLYKLVRHPLMLGFIIAFWSTPTMTVGHLFFAGMVTAYILVGTTIEERDLVAAFGDRYLDYRRRVPGLIPFLRLPGRLSRM